MFKTKTHKLNPLDRLTFNAFRALKHVITNKNSLQFHSTAEKPDYYDCYHID